MLKEYQSSQGKKKPVPSAATKGCRDIQMPSCRSNNQVWIHHNKVQTIQTNLTINTHPRYLTPALTVVGSTGCPGKTTALLGVRPAALAKNYTTSRESAEVEASGHGWTTSMTMLLLHTQCATSHIQK